MSAQLVPQRHFCFLQGPAGRFFRALARSCRDHGAKVSRLGFSFGDYVEWGITAQPGPYRAWRGRLADFSGFFRQFLVAQGVTDIVLYNDARPYHQLAIKVARALGVRTHIFEEGYLRAGYITYEREGVNGWSPLAQLDTEHSSFQRLPLAGRIPPGVPMGGQWHYIWHGCRYYFWNFIGRPFYPFSRGHRPMPLWLEALSWWPRLLTYPWRLLLRQSAMEAAAAKASNYDLVLLQLGADSQMRVHSPYRSMWAFLKEVIETFALDAPSHDRALVIKTHPLELGTECLGLRTAMLARALGLRGRVIYIDGGKLQPLLNGARAVLTINSTAGQQALQMGLPVFAAGRSIYGGVGLAASGDMRAFLRNPTPPDEVTRLRYQYLLLRGCQVPGGYYHRVAQAAAVAGCVARMFDERPPVCRVGLADVPRRSRAAQPTCDSAVAQAKSQAEFEMLGVGEGSWT